ncbi:four-carbon acid sugar kinase family protein [Alicyclobacillus macrosporangiidus]|uniref:Uncharacterized conserved protein YgbK, DUF1537 family n=1 Tax=Alicyclobacillus macrosporangiidus TaxID=392015 RepID=A0A1I7K0J2_9BACL|nr:four-carbon acid sugar kinase family protein [Alicyclobacillus macrosporangiidus]SFU90947.1 Uncharacterized conserved protein YgbK, DUF1537 family [Alicyclobacillus macrosporangiidus]
MHSCHPTDSGTAERPRPLDTDRHLLPGVCILADDLTGAADAANYFRTGLYRVRVSLNPDAPWDPALGPHVVQVADTESRAAEPEEAWRRVARAAGGLKDLGSRLGTAAGALHVYKKVDSTLRGHLGIELEAALEALGRRIAVFAPSFPANGRQVVGGRLSVHGTPVHQTAFAQDPRNPIESDRVADVIAQGTQLPVDELPLSVLRSGPAAAASWLDALGPGTRVVVADAETEDDLAVIADAFAAREDVLLCGSAGLAKQLPRHWLAKPDAETDASADRSRQDDAAGTAQAHDPCDRVLVLVGSANPAAHRQLEVLAQQAGIRVTELDPVQLAHPQTTAEELARATQDLVQSTAAREREGSAGPVLAAAALGTRRPAGASGRRFEDDLAAAAKIWFERAAGQAIGFVATGGDTALALCRAIGVHAIWPEGEVAPGIPWNTIETPRGRALLVTKAGGFGTEDALWRAVQFLTSY